MCVSGQRFARDSSLAGQSGIDSPADARVLTVFYIKTFQVLAELRKKRVKIDTLMTIAGHGGICNCPNY
jgi:hypothetical protein